MGTTTNGLPYPDGSDPFADGDLAIRALAEAVDLRIFGAWAMLGRSTDQTIPTDGGPIGWGADVSEFSDEFALANSGSGVAQDLVVYTGPTRLVAWAWTMSWPTQISGTRQGWIQPGDNGLGIGFGFGARVASPVFDLAFPVIENAYGHAGVMLLTDGAAVELTAWQDTGSGKAVRPTMVLKGL